MLEAVSRIACTVAIAAALLSRPDAPQPLAFHFSTTITPPPPVVLPPPAPAAASRPSCPPPRRDAPRVVPDLPEDITDVAPAPTNAGWIAAWNEDHVFVSHDAGATFTRALDGPGHVLGASFDCFGRLVVLRGNQVGVADTWHEVRGLDRESEAGGVIGGGPDVVVVGRSGEYGGPARVAISSDGGATWGYRDAGGPLDNDAKVRGRQRDDGSIEIAYSIANCMDDVLETIAIRSGEVSSDRDELAEGAPFAIDATSIVAEDRWRPRAGGDWRELDVPGDGGIRVTGGAFTVIARDDATYRFDRGKLRRLPVVVAGTLQAVDLAGRIWSIADGRVLATNPSRASTSGSAGGTDRR